MSERPMTPEEFRARHGAGARQATERSRRHEELVTTAIQWLNLQIVNGQRVAAWRVDTGRHLHRREDGGWGIGQSFGTKGALDITGIVPGLGRRLDVDAKVGKDKLTHDQAKFVVTVRQCGGIAFAFHDSLDDLIRRFKQALQEVEP